MGGFWNSRTIFTFCPSLNFGSGWYIVSSYYGAKRLMLPLLYQSAVSQYWAYLFSQ